MAMPEGWEEVSIGQICDLVNGKAFKPTDWTATGLPIVRIQNLNKSGAKFNYYGGKIESKFLVENGDLLFAWSGTPGTSFGAHVWAGPKAVLNQHIFNIKFSRNAIDTNFFKYAINQTLDEQIEKAHGGVGLRHVTKGKFEETRVPLPPLSEQRRIIAKIDSLSAKTERARDHLNHVPRLVAAYRQAVLVAAFTGRLTADWRRNIECVQSAAELVAATDEPGRSRGGRDATDAIKPGQAALSINKPDLHAPENWAWVRLARIARQETGHTPSRSNPEYWDGGVPWIGIRDAGAHHGRLIHHTNQTISDLGLRNSSARLLPAGTVCLSRTASVGYVTIMGVPMATSQDFATWTCTDALDPKYLMYALMAEGERIRDFGEGSTHTTIYFPEIRALHICLAPKLEQAEIVRRVEAAFSWIDRLASEAMSARKLIDHLDQAILSKAFRGELVPQDPDDEPASVLLERIKAEQAGATPARRGRGRPRVATAI